MKVIADTNGNILVSSGSAIEITAAVDSNIVAGNIKKDVTILGVTGTYEGSGGGGSSTTTFYVCTTTNPATQQEL